MVIEDFAMLEGEATAQHLLYIQSGNGVRE